MLEIVGIKKQLEGQDLDATVSVLNAKIDSVRKLAETTASERASSFEELSKVAANNASEINKFILDLDMRPSRNEVSNMVSLLVSLILIFCCSWRWPYLNTSNQYQVKSSL